MPMATPAVLPRFNRLLAGLVPLELRDADAAAPDGAVRTRRLILYSGTFDQQGGAGEFTVTASHLAEMVANFEREGTDVFVTFGHPWDLDGEAAVAWITDLVLVTPEQDERVPSGETGLAADFLLLADTAAALREGRFRYFSPTFITEGTDETGEPVGARLLSGAITNFPFLKNLGPFELAEITGEHRMSDENKAPEAETQEPTLAALAESVSSLTTALEEIRTSIADIDSRVTSLSEQATPQEAAELSENATDVVKLAATVKAQGEIIEGLRRGVKADAIKRTVSLAEETGKLTPAMRERMLPNFNADPVKALEDSKVFRGDLNALAEFVSSTEPVINLGGRESSSLSPEDDGSSEGLVVLSDEEAKRIGFADSADFLKYQRLAAARG